MSGLRLGKRSAFSTSSLAMGRGVVSGGGAYQFINPEAASYVTRAASDPSNARKSLFDSLCTELKAKNIFGLFDVLCLIANFEGQLGRQNLIADQYNLSPFSSPVFATDRGYTTDGSASYLDPLFIPATAPGAKFTQTSGHIGFWSLTARQAGAVDMGNTSTLLTARNSSDFRSHRVNWSVSGSAISATDGSGHFVTSRTGSLNTDNALYRDGALAMSSVSAGALQALENNPIQIGKRGGSSAFSSRQFAIVHIGAGLTAQNVSDLHTALRNYLTAIGAV